MNIKSCEKKEKSEYEIIVEVSPEEFETAVGKAFIKNKNRVAVPGFRKGKAPRKIIERMYGASIFHPDALDIILPDVLEFADKETDLKVVGYPRVSDVDIREDKSGVDVIITAAVYPEISVGEYKGLSAVMPDVEIPESAVDAEIAGIRMRNARIEKADRPAIEGDIAVIDYEGFVDGETFEGGKGENYELELGSKTFIPGFEDQVIGMATGEERDVNLVFPEQYVEHLANKPVVFKVKMNEIKEKQLPELDDEFAKDVSEFDTLDEYKADIRDRLKKARQTEADAAFENALLDKIVETMDADVPDALVEEQMDVAANNFAGQIQAYGMDPASYLKMMNMTPDMFRENLRVSSEKQVKIMLALEKIAELEAFEVSDEDVENEYKDAAERFDMEVEKLRESVDKEKIIQEIKTRRAARLVTDTAVKEAPPPADAEDKADESKKAEKPAAKAKKPAAKKTTAKKAETDTETVAEDKAPAKEKETAETGTEEKPKKAAAKKPAAKKPAAKKAEGE